MAFFSAFLSPLFLFWPPPRTWGTRITLIISVCGMLLCCWGSFELKKGQVGWHLRRWCGNSCRCWCYSLKNNGENGKQGNLFYWFKFGTFNYLSFHYTLIINKYDYNYNIEKECQEIIKTLRACLFLWYNFMNFMFFRKGICFYLNDEISIIHFII